MDKLSQPFVMHVDKLLALHCACAAVQLQACEDFCIAKKRAPFRGTGAPQAITAYMQPAFLHILT